MSTPVQCNGSAQLLNEIARYSTAVVATGLATWVRYCLAPWLGDECPFSFYYLSTLLTAWMAGTRQAVFAVILGTVAAAHFFVPPESSLYVAQFSDRMQLIVYVIVNCVAIHLFRRVERQMVEARNQSIENQVLSESLKEAGKRKDEFLALLAHELRNPLSSIQSGVTALTESYSTEKVVRICEILSRNTNHLTHLTNDLLDVSRFTRGMISLKTSRIDLREAMLDALEMTSETFRQKKHRVHRLIPDTPILIDGDHVRLTQMIGNLLSNSAKFTPDGGRITVELARLESTVVLTVEDNGIGFPSHESSKIFEPFVQLNSSRSREQGGLGLGLAIVQRLTQLHRGTLSAFSQGPGYGSRFTVELPLPQDSDSLTGHGSPAEKHPSPASPADSHARPARSASKQFRILLVDDNVDASTLLCELLESNGFDVSMTTDGLQAIELAATLVPDLAILDIGLPGMDGFEVARRLRASMTTKPVRLIALSGWTPDLYPNNTIRRCFDEYLVKPVMFPELLKTIRELLQTPVQNCTPDRSTGHLDHVSQTKPAFQSEHSVN